MQYARSKVDYVISESIYMLPSDMNLQIGKIKNYSNKILVSSSSFKTGTNLKINLDGEKDKPDIKPKGEGMWKLNLKLTAIMNTNRMLNLTSSSKKKTNRMLR